MATLQASFCRTHRETIRATINIPNPRMITSSVCLPKFPSRNFMEELDTIRSSGSRISTSRQMEKEKDTISDPVVMAKLYAVMEAIADRVEMHKNIGEQRNNWNSLLLTSINAVTLTAAIMSGIVASSAAGAPILPLKLSATLLYAAAAGMLVVMNKIQPSQLAEEQRNAARLFKQLHSQIQTNISIGSVPTMVDVKEAMEKVLALDKAYPLPLIGAMLDKFPTTVEPALWWPQQYKRRRQVENFRGKKMDGNNGWNENLEAEMKEIVGVLKRKDMDEYLRLSKTALKVNKILAISGPMLTGFAALGSAFVGASGSHGTWAAVVAVVAGALASVVNTMEHGGQVGMVFEMYRSNAGFFKLMEESIESNLNERDVERRDNGEVFEMKLALHMGRSLSELKHLAESSSSRNGKAADHEEFASKLF